MKLFYLAFVLIIIWTIVLLNSPHKTLETALEIKQNNEETMKIQNILKEEKAQRLRK